MSNNKIKGRKIEGDITRPYRPHVEQGTVKEFLEEIDSILAIDGVEAVAWEQYTPYFNDGDVCEFGVYDPRVKLSFGDDDGGDYGDGTYEHYDLYYGSSKNPVFEMNGHNTKEIYDALCSLDLDRFENIAQENFGDHATVTATKDGFSVEYYEHE